MRLGRWERLLGDVVDMRVWRAISWKGGLEISTQDNKNRLSGDEFKLHLQRVLNSDPEPQPLSATADVTIQILDDPISPTEVSCQIRKLKVDKVCRPDGLSPDVLTMLPPAWLLTLTTLFNIVFASGVYPASWMRAKLFTFFKRGNRSDPNDCRGISFITAIKMLYDMVL